MVGDLARALSRGGMILFPFPHARDRVVSRSPSGRLSAYPYAAERPIMFQAVSPSNPTRKRGSSSWTANWPRLRARLDEHLSRRHDRSNPLGRDGELQSAQAVFTLSEGYSTQPSGRGSASNGRGASGGKKLIRFFDRIVNVTYIRLVGHAHLVSRPTPDGHRTRQTSNEFCRAGLPARSGWNQIALSRSAPDTFLGCSDPTLLAFSPR